MSGSSDTHGADFDFLIGAWQVRHRRLARRLAGCQDWVEFVGTSVARKLLGGFGNIDENHIPLPGDPYVGVTLRTYDPKAQIWSIHWFDSRHPSAHDPPMAGRFAEGAGTFYGEHIFEARPVRVRFIWSRDAATRCRWQQAFSVDAGGSWETNWIMDFSRS